MKKVLVAYGSKRGSTGEVARRIAETIDKKAYEVDVSPIESVKDIEGYSGLVLGSSVYMGQWHKNFVKFLKANEDALTKRPVWLFSTGPTGEGDPLELTKGWSYPKKFEPLINKIAPVEVAVFHGKLSEASMSSFDRFIINKVKAPIGDFRQWEMIEHWSEGITLD